MRIWFLAGRILSDGGGRQSGISIFSRVAYHRDGCEDRNGFAFSNKYFQEDAITGGFHRHCCFIRIGFKQQITFVDRIADLLVPFDQFALFLIETEFGHNNDLSHVTAPFMPRCYSISRILAAMVVSLGCIACSRRGVKGIGMSGVHRRWAGASRE